MKKILAILIVFLFMIQGFGCSSTEYTPKNLPDYESTKDSLHMQIGAWHMPALTKEDFQDYKDAGFNAAYFGGQDEVHLGGANFQKALDLCEEFDINAIMSIRNQLGHEYTEDFSGYEYAKYIHVYDEPNASVFPKLAAEAERIYNTYGENVVFDVNLFPMYASENSLGVNSYDEYIRLFVEQVLSKVKGEKRLSVDYYPLAMTNGKRYLPVTWLRNLEIMAKYAKEYDLTTHMFIQSMPFGKSNNVVPTDEDFSLQVYTSLAYGMKEISHFCYVTPGVGGDFSEEQVAIIDRNNEKTVLYERAKKINELIAKIDNLYLSFDWVGTMPVLGSNTQRNNLFRMLEEPLYVEDLDNIKSIKSDNDIIVGCFEDEQKNDAYMIVNFNETSLNLTCNVNLEFMKYRNALVYVNGEKTVRSLKDGKLDLALKSGEGVFVIPY